MRAFFLEGKNEVLLFMYQLGVMGSCFITKNEVFKKM